MFWAPRASYWGTVAIDLRTSCIARSHCCVEGFHTHIVYISRCAKCAGRVRSSGVATSGLSSGCTPRVERGSTLPPRGSLQAVYSRQEGAAAPCNGHQSARESTYDESAGSRPHYSILGCITHFRQHGYSALHRTSGLAGAGSKVAIRPPTKSQTCCVVSTRCDVSSSNRFSVFGLMDEVEHQRFRPAAPGQRGAAAAHQLTRSVHGTSKLFKVTELVSVMYAPNVRRRPLRIGDAFREVLVAMLGSPQWEKTSSAWHTQVPWR
jgi:hypothetical protein